MQLLTQPNKWSCLLTSWAMVLGVEIDHLVAMIGHDGSEICYPSQPEPARRRCFHIAEFIEIAKNFGFAIVQVELNPVWGDLNQEPCSECATPEAEIMHHLHGGNEEHLKRWLNSYSGVITGQTIPGDQWHAVAWCGETYRIFDPSGHRRLLREFKVHTFWAAVESKW